MSWVPCFNRLMPDSQWYHLNLYPRNNFFLSISLLCCINLQVIYLEHLTQLCTVQFSLQFTVDVSGTADSAMYCIALCSVYS